MGWAVGARGQARPQRHVGADSTATRRATMQHMRRARLVRRYGCMGHNTMQDMHTMLVFRRRSTSANDLAPALVHRTRKTSTETDPRVAFELTVSHAFGPACLRRGDAQARSASPPSAPPLPDLVGQTGTNHQPQELLAPMVSLTPGARRQQREAASTSMRMSERIAVGHWHATNPRSRAC